MGDCIFEFCTKFCVNISMSDVFLYSMFDTVYSVLFIRKIHTKRMPSYGWKGILFYIIG